MRIRGDAFDKLQDEGHVFLDMRELGGVTLVLEDASVRLEDAASEPLL